MRDLKPRVTYPGPRRDDKPGNGTRLAALSEPMQLAMRCPTRRVTVLLLLIEMNVHRKFDSHALFKMKLDEVLGEAATIGGGNK
jgi:hypothetical protein